MTLPDYITQPAELLGLTGDHWLQPGETVTGWHYLPPEGPAWRIAIDPTGWHITCWPHGKPGAGLKIKDHASPGELGPVCATLARLAQVACSTVTTVEGRWPMPVNPEAMMRTIRAYEQHLGFGDISTPGPDLLKPPIDTPLVAFHDWPDGTPSVHDLVATEGPYSVVFPITARAIEAMIGPTLTPELQRWTGPTTVEPPHHQPPPVCATLSRLVKVAAPGFVRLDGDTWTVLDLSEEEPGVGAFDAPRDAGAHLVLHGSPASVPFLAVGPSRGEQE